jgi:hypothetical protein
LTSPSPLPLLSLFHVASSELLSGSHPGADAGSYSTFTSSIPTQPSIWLSSPNPNSLDDGVNIRRSCSGPYPDLPGGPLNSHPANCGQNPDHHLGAVAQGSSQLSTPTPGSHQPHSQPREYRQPDVHHSHGCPILILALIVNHITPTHTPAHLHPTETIVQESSRGHSQFKPPRNRPYDPPSRSLTFRSRPSPNNSAQPAPSGTDHHPSHPSHQILPPHQHPGTEGILIQGQGVDGDSVSRASFVSLGQNFPRGQPGQNVSTGQPGNR